MLYTGKVLSTVSPHLNLRDAPNGTDIGDIYANDTITADNLQAGWLHIVTVNGLPKVGWSSCAYLEYQLVTEGPTPQAIEYVMVHFTDGTAQRFNPE